MTFSEIFMTALMIVAMPFILALAFYAVKFLYELGKLAIQLIVDDIK